MDTNNPVDVARESVCDRVGCNVYGRTKEFLRHAERGDDAAARGELLALLKFFPPAKR